MTPIRKASAREQLFALLLICEGSGYPGSLLTRLEDIQGAFDKSWYDQPRDAVWIPHINGSAEVKLLASESYRELESLLGIYIKSFLEELNLGGLSQQAS